MIKYRKSCQREVVDARDIEGDKGDINIVFSAMPVH